MCLTLALVLGAPGSRGLWAVATTQPASQPALSGRDFDAHVAALKARVPAGFSVVVARPFVVIGDEPLQAVQARAEGTVGWAVRALRKQYFSRDPDRIIDIWLFKDKDSYEKHARELFNDRPTTPYGYYSERHAALIMNIATGGGTLVHEIVHPFIRANFPGCPAWLNEGLGSLYEQSGERDGQIVGYTNWRLSGLQDAIRQGRTVSFQKLTGLTDAEFYGPGNGLHYAQARYLCYYLQEKGVLAKYYHRFHAARAEDPTGYGTLQAVLGEADMEAFRKSWEKYVLALRFP